MHTTRRDFLTAAGLSTAGLTIRETVFSLMRAAVQTSSANNPNILLLMTDQQRFDSLSCYGCKAVATPNLDRLAKEGALFEHCYSPNPICTPTRASLMTGHHLPGHGVYKLHDILPDDQVMFPERLKILGYKTALIGKLHASGLWYEAEHRHPNDGFEHYQWCIDPGLNFDSPYNAYARWVKAKDPIFFNERLKKEGKLLRHFPAEMHNSRWACETVIKLLKERDENKPFCMFVSLFDPHDPYFDYPLEMADKVHTEHIPTAHPLPDDPHRPSGVHRELAKSSTIRQSDTFGEGLEEMRKGYYASIAFLDQEIGKVLDYLDANDLTDNTLVMFVSDHGDMLFDRDLFSKGGYFYDPSVRVPLLIRFPGRIQAGRRVSEPVQVHDLTATILAAAGISDEQLWQWMPDSQNLLRPLESANVPFRDYAVCLFRNTGYGPGGAYFDPPLHASMFRDKRYKLNVFHTFNGVGRIEGELYDMLNDPLETRNLWASTAHLSIKQELMGRLLDWLARQEIAHLSSRGGEKVARQVIDYYGDRSD